MAMSLKDVESLLQPVAGANPCGADLEYDPAFLDLERLVQGKPEQQMGRRSCRRRSLTGRPSPSPQLRSWARPRTCGSRFT
jgi:hypothetical protein